MHQLRQQQLARYLGMSPQGLWNIVHSRSEPRSRTAQRIAAAFGITMDSLLADTRLRLVGPAPVAGALRAGAAVVDGRTPQAFDAGHLPGAVNVPAGPGAGELAALVLSRDVPVLALAARLEEAGELEAELEAAGF